MPGTLEHGPCACVLSHPVRALLFLSRGFIFEHAQSGKQGWNVATDNAPKGIVVDAKIAVDQSVARGDNEPPRNLRIGRTHCIRHMGRCLADQFQIAQGGIVVKSAGDKIRLIEALC